MRSMDGCDCTPIQRFSRAFAKHSPNSISANPNKIYCGKMDRTNCWQWPSPCICGTSRLPEAHGLRALWCNISVRVYSLYPVLAAIHGANINGVRLNEDFSPPSLSAQGGHNWDFQAALTFITTPNAPTGHGYTTRELEQLCLKQKGVVVLDEAYVDFAHEHALELALKHPHVLVARTFSKAYSLCFQRIGYFVGAVSLIEALGKIRDSYNVNGLGQVAALATLSDLKYYRGNFKRIISSRDQAIQLLEKLGFQSLPSQANFIFVRPPKFPARLWLEKLREQKILVRWFDYPETRDYLRITIGAEDEMEVLLKTVQSLLR